MQWVVPASTGLLLAVTSYAREQQCASEVAKCTKRKFSLSRS